MGQYYYVVNVDKKQYLHAHKFGDGLKLLEFGASGGGTMLGLAVLLSDGNGRGGGDLSTRGEGLLKDPRKLVGSWAGDRIVITGDYADDGNFVPADFKTMRNEDGEEFHPNLYHVACEHFEDISPDILAVMCQDSYIREQHKNSDDYEPELLNQKPE